MVYGDQYGMQYSMTGPSADSPGVPALRSWPRYSNAEERGNPGVSGGRAGGLPFRVD
jgi:hypothetical protein